MNQVTTRPFRARHRQEDLSVLHFKRFLEAFSAPTANGCAQWMQPNAKFRVLHVKRRFGAAADRASAPVGQAQERTRVDGSSAAPRI